MKLILGLGETGFSIARFLAKQQIAFKLADNRGNPPLLPAYQNKFNRANLILGDWTPDLLTNINEIFISPGIAQSEPIVVWARAKNIPISSDIELFSRYAKAPVIGITGSNGKSTVTQLLGEMIASEGKTVALGGNIGKPALNCLHDEVDYYVLELSSYQLDYTQKIKLLTGVVLNIAPDHLDRYLNFEEYINSKLSLYTYCQHWVVNVDEPRVPNNANAKHFGIDMPKHPNDFGSVTCHGHCYLLKGEEVLMDINQVPLIGKHNISNMLCALALGDQIGLGIESMLESIKNFKGLEHRLEWVAKKHGIDYYNDSKATNATATTVAIKALTAKHKNITLILGGTPKHEDYRELFALIDKNIANVMLIGQSANVFSSKIKIAQTTRANSMQSAVNLASHTDCQAVLLSPGCASFDLFDNFEHRGRAFKQSIDIL